MKKKAKEKQRILKFSELPNELSTHFILRGLFCLAMIVAVILFFIFTKLTAAFFVILAGILLYTGINLYNYFCVITGKVLVYQGFFEQKHRDELALPTKRGKAALLSGPTSIILKPVNGDITEKYIVPIGNGFSAYPGNIVTIYSKPEDVHPKGENAFTFDNPLLVKVTKI